MSARVFNPILVSDLRNLRTATANEVRPSPTLQALGKIRRNLFGPVDHESSRKFVDQELSKMQTQASERWGFDFETERPLPGHNRYDWERVNGSTKVPKVYSFRIPSQNIQQAAPVESQFVPVQIDTVSVVEEELAAQPENTERVQKGEVTPPSQIQKLDDSKCITSKLSGNSRQLKITSFMKHCKRPITAKKLDNSHVKKRRLTQSTSS